MKTEESMNKDKNNFEEKNETSTVIGYSFDRYGKPRLKKSRFNLDINKDNVEKNKIENILIKINNKRKNHKEQILMRNKFQHTKNYTKKIIPNLNNNIRNEYNKYIDFKNEAINRNSRFNTENQEMKSYDTKGIFARDFIKEKMPNFKVTGFDQLYMNLLTSVRPNKNDNYK